MKVLVVGLGSIAKKHIKAINDLQVGAEIFALRSNLDADNYQDVKNVFSWSDCPNDIDFVIISNPSSMHYQAICEGIKLNCPLLIEKPPVVDLNHALTLEKELLQNKIKTYIAFNLRFHPILEWIKININTSEVLEANAYCGSYLPEWRKGIS